MVPQDNKFQPPWLKPMTNLRLGTIVSFLLWTSLGMGSAIALIGNLPSGNSSPPQSLPSPTEQIEAPATDEPKRFKVLLTLSAVSDLKVREGDGVRVGQLLSDRPREREKLQFQKQQLQLRLQQLSSPIPTTPIPPVAPLPPPTFLQNLAEIQSQQLKVDEANKQLALQQRKLDFLKGLPDDQVPKATIEHEERKTEERERAVNQAIAQLQLAQSKLAQAQKERAYEEYTHSLELAKLRTTQEQQQLERDKQQRDRAYQVAQLQTQLANLYQFLKVRLQITPQGWRFFPQ